MALAVAGKRFKLVSGLNVTAVQFITYQPGVAVGKCLPAFGPYGIHRQAQFAKAISLGQPHCGERMSRFTGTGVPGHGTFLAARILGAAVLEDAPGLVLSLEVAGPRRLDDIAGTASPGG